MSSLTDRYLPAVSSITKRRTKYLYRAQSDVFTTEQGMSAATHKAATQFGEQIDTNGQERTPHCRRRSTTSEFPRAEAVQMQMALTPQGVVR